MAQTNYTPISLYYSATASNVPTAANLVPGELAINTADGKLYYEDSSGVVQVLATKSTGSIGGSNTQVQFNNSGSLGGSSGLTWDGSFLTTSSIKNSALTSGRVTYAGASGLLSDSANLTYGTGLSVNGISQVFQTGLFSTDGTLSNYSVNNGVYLNGNATGWSQLSGDGTRATFVRVWGSGASPANFIVLNTAGSERMRVDSSGNVGIGTSSPDSYATGAKNLVIASSGDSGMTIRSGTTSTGVISFANAENSTSNNGIFEFNHNDLAMNFNIYGTGRSYRFKSAGTEVLRIDSSGNVGIGTTSPSDTLSVINSTMTNQIVMGLNTTDTTYGSISFSGSNSGANRIGLTGGGGSDKSLYLDSPTGGAFYFRINAVNRQEISSSGIVTMSAYGAGAATFAANGTISSVSDETWKTKDGVPTNTDAMLQKLEPGYWFYNEEKAPIFGADRQLGFYAQNVHEAIGAEAAPTPEEGKPWGYYDRSVLAVVVMSLKNALNTIEELKQRIETLENK